MGFKSLFPQQKLEALAKAAQWDVFEGESHLEQKLPRCWIYPASSSGKAVPILKVLLSNNCIYNCLYCAHRAERGFIRTSFEPEELAQIFWQMNLRGVVEGIFLSSSIDKSPNDTMEKLLKCAEIIRGKYGFSGYLHLKIMPGSSAEYIERAAELASRISINIETPQKSLLQSICPNKAFDDILSMLSLGAKIVKDKGKSQTTQLIIGLGEKDKEVLSLSFKLYLKLGLRRCYFSPFTPIPQTPLEGFPPPHKIRTRRLYQADFLIREYGFLHEELVFDEKENLPQDIDPKLAWALKHKESFPVEVNSASYHELIRVPGIGPRTAHSIISRRKWGPIKRIEEMVGLGVAGHRAAPFILLDGKQAQREIKVARLCGE